MKTTLSVILLLGGSLACGLTVQESGSSNATMPESMTTSSATDLTDARGASDAHAARFYGRRRVDPSTRLA